MTRGFLAAVCSALALLLVPAALAGCGGESDEDAVRGTVTAFGKATADKDFDRLCGDLLAPALLDSLEEIGLPCRVALQQSLRGVEEPRLVVGEIRVDGEQAEVDVRSSAAGQAPSQDTLRLVKVDEDWRIADLGGEPAQP
jgi:hypothetical protein